MSVGSNRTARVSVPPSMRHGLAGSDSFSVLLTVPRARFPKSSVLRATSVRRAEKCVEKLKLRVEARVEGATIEVTGTATPWPRGRFHEDSWRRENAPHHGQSKAPRGRRG